MTRIVFFGTPEFAVPSLKKLSGVVGVVTAPDKPLGRKQVLTPSPVKTTALDLGLPVFTPATLKDTAFFETFKNLKPDLCIVVAYGKLIPQKYLDVPQLGFVNVHPSLLPAYRGPSPIQSAILDGCASTGVSIMLLDAEIDHGPVLAQESYTIPTDAYFPQVEHDLAKLGASLLKTTLDKQFEPQEQDHANATFTKKFTREDGKIDWSQPAITIYNRIRALAGNPGTWTVVNGKTLNILRAHIADNKVAPDLVQLEGGKPMDWDAFLRGHPNLDKLG